MNSQWSNAKCAFVIVQWEMDIEVSLHRKFYASQGYMARLSQKGKEKQGLGEQVQSLYNKWLCIHWAISLAQNVIFFHKAFRTMQWK